MGSIVKTEKEQLREERQKNERLTAALAKANADLEYIAMMADIDLDSDQDDGHGREGV